MSWYVAKTSGRETRALVYLGRAGIRAFRPEKHSYFICKRTKLEKHRVLSLFTGYVFFEAARQEEISKAKAAIGVSAVLGDLCGSVYRYRDLPEGWVEQLIEVGPIIEGRKKRFCNGDQVRAVISGISSIVGTVEAHNGRVVQLRTTMFGTEKIVNVNESKVEAA